MLKTKLPHTLAQATDDRSGSSISVLVLFALTNWLSHFFYFQDFGLYEDDYAFIADAMARNASYLLEKLNYVVLFPQGRPVGFYCAALLAFIGDKVGGLWADYLIGFIIITLNAFLFYRLLKATQLEVLAVTGGLFFCLFPADTTKNLLTHAFILQLSLTFLLAASLFYLANRRLLSYIIILGSLLSYESAFMVFFGIPLFKKRWDKIWLKHSLKHVAILLLYMLVTAFIRWLSHENRVSSLVTQPDQWTLLLPKVLSAMMLGLHTSLSLLITAPLGSIAHWNGMTYLAVALCCLLFLLKFAALNVPFVYKIIRLPSTLSNLAVLAVLDHQKLPDYYLKILKFLLVGLVLTCLSYSLAITMPHYPPTVEKGRLTSVHLAASMGVSLLGACLVSLLLAIATANRLKPGMVVLLSLYFTCLAGYQFTIQLDYKQSWQNQRMFWTDVLAASPDLDETTTILVVDHNLPKTDFILTHSWADPLILKQIVRSPHPPSNPSNLPPVLAESSWSQPPVLFLVSEDWQNQVTLQGRSWNVPLATWQGFSTTVVPESTIVLLPQDGHLMRLDEPITIHGQSFKLKSTRNMAKTSFKPGPLFKSLIDEQNRDLPFFNGLDDRRLLAS